MADKKQILTAFNNHFWEFVEDIERVFPGDRDILKARTMIEGLQKVNPKALVKLWNGYVTVPYGEEIAKGNIDFFLTKDYSTDVKGDQKAIEAIERLRTPIRNMENDNKDKAMKYIQNLTKLSAMLV